MLCYLLICHHHLFECEHLLPLCCPDFDIGSWRLLACGGELQDQLAARLPLAVRKYLAPLSAPCAPCWKLQSGENCAEVMAMQNRCGQARVNRARRSSPWTSQAHCLALLSEEQQIQPSETRETRLINLATFHRHIILHPASRYGPRVSSSRPLSCHHTRLSFRFRHRQAP